MATLTIRDLPEDTRNRLRVRAAQNGRSMEAEARAILAGSVNAPSAISMPDAIVRLQLWIAQGKKKQAIIVKVGKVDPFIKDRRRNAIREAIEDGHHPKELFGREYTRIAAEAGWTLSYIDGLMKRQSA